MQPFLEEATRLGSKVGLISQQCMPEVLGMLLTHSEQPACAILFLHAPSRVASHCQVTEAKSELAFKDLPLWWGVQPVETGTCRGTNPKGSKHTRHRTPIAPPAKHRKDC